jgi:tetratricopeptide (TPR) repeat protein
MRAVFNSQDVDRQLQAGDLLCDLLENRGDTDGWAQLIEEMTGLEDEAGDVGRCALLCARSMWLSSVGRAMEGLIAAQKALSLAGSGPPAQRAAQRLAFAYLPQMELDAALSAAQRSLLEAGEVPLLRARSLRILGLVELWQHKPTAIKTLQSVPVLCRSTGLMTRYPIALHDLGDAYRLNEQVEQAREKYQETIKLCEGLPLSSTLALCHFKLAMCDILQGRGAEIFDGMPHLIVQGESVGLGSSARFGALLCGWAHAVQGDIDKSVSQLDVAGPLDTIVVDPQVPHIISECCDRLVDAVLSSPGALKHSPAISDLCRQAREVFGTSGDMDRLQRVERLLQRLPHVPI